MANPAPGAVTQGTPALAWSLAGHRLAYLDATTDVLTVWSAAALPAA